MSKGKPTTEQRRAFVISMKDAGLTFEQIADEAIKKFGKHNLPKGYNKRLACLDVKRQLKKNPPPKLKSELRKNKIFQYRMAGMSYHQIFEQLRQELGKDGLPARYSERHACRDLTRYLQKLSAENKQALIETRNLHRERLNFLLNTLWEKASQGDLQSIDRVLIITKILSKLDDMDNVAPSTASPGEKTCTTFAEWTKYFAENND
jgi:hypothetical protein